MDLIIKNKYYMGIEAAGVRHREKCSTPQNVSCFVSLVLALCKVLPHHKTKLN